MIVALLLTSVQFCSVDAQDALEKQIEKMSRPYIESGTVVGMSIGVIKDGKATTVNLGAIKNGGAAPHDETVYEIGSISKVFTGILLADAVVTKSVELDQAAKSLLPEDVTMPNWKEREITLKELSTHSSGLPRLSNNMPSLSSNNPYSDYTSQLAYEFLNSHKLARKPGSKTEYSNYAVSLLGHLICSQSGTSYEDLLRERICKPLGMNDTKVALTESMKERLATPHAASGEEDHNWDFADMPGAGGIRSTIKDMLIFAQANLEEQAGEIGEALDLAWKKHRGGQPSLGLGWHIAGDGSTRWHNGGTGGYHSMMLVNRKLDMAVVVLSNTSASEVDQLGQQLMQMMAGQSVKPRKFEKEFKVSDEAMQRYVGEYQLAPKVVFTIFIEDGKLMVGITGQPAHQVYARSETEWFYKVVDASITFKVNKKGKCTGLILNQNGMNQKARKTK